jgi:glycosyltransferase 2 family protein
MTKRRLTFLTAKAIFTAAILAYLFRKIDVARVWTTIRGAERGPISLGLLLALVTIVIAGWRWHRWLAIFNIHIRLLSLTLIAQIGQFFLMFLPGPVGDDLTRMLYISRIIPTRVGEACVTVLLDRCLGLASVLLLALVCIPWHWGVLSVSVQTHWLAVAIVSGGLFVCIFGVLFFLAGHPTHSWFEKRLRSLPAHSFRDEAVRIWGLLCLHKPQLVRILSGALLTQLLLCLVFYFAGISVGITAPLHVWLSFVPIVLAANAIPITIAGLGVREYLLILFLGVLANVKSERALAASFVAFAIILGIALMGGVLYIFYWPKAVREAADNGASVADPASVSSRTV